MKIRLLSVVPALLALTACPDSGSSSGGSAAAPPPVILNWITISPASSTIDPGANVTLTATGHYSDGTTGAVDAEWKSSSVAITLDVPEGSIVTATGAASGSATVTATAQGVSGQVMISVRVVLDSITVSPATPSIDPGATTLLAATGLYSDGSQVPVSASWLSSNGHVSLSAAQGASVTATGASSGQATVTATFEGKSAQSAVTVKVVLNTISVAPVAGTIDTGEDLALTATGHYSDGSQAGVNAAWQTPDATVSLSAAQGPSITVTGVSAGSATVTASFQGKTAQASITVDPPPVTLAAITVSPASSTLDVGHDVELSATGHYSDGSSAAVDAAWEASSAHVSLSAPQGVSVLATALSGGPATVTATFGGKTDQCEITVNAGPAADPGAVFGTDASGIGVAKYAPGAGAPATISALAGTGGFAMDVDDAHLYVLEGLAGAAGQKLHRISATTGTGGVVGVFPNGSMGLAVDSQGRVYTHGYSTGLLHRYDPADGSVALVGHGIPLSYALSIGPDDAPYYMVAVAWAPGAQWIARHNLVTDVVTTWAAAPAGLWGEVNAATSGGFAFNRTGEAFVADFYARDIYRLKDLNGDGDALDAGESMVYGTLPLPRPDVNANPDWEGMNEYSILGLAAPKNGGVVVNVQPSDWWVAAPLGIHRLVDLDGDGVCTGAGETPIYNPHHVWNPFPDGLVAER